MSSRRSGAILFAVLALFLSVSVVGAGAASAKTPPLTSPASIAIDNGIINIDVFGEAWSDYDVWLYPAGRSNCCYEEPLLAYGENLPVWLSAGTVTSPYPATGVPGVWYDATIDLDLDADPGDDVTLTRSIAVPSGQKYFLVRYSVQNITGADLPDFRFFQFVDYDVAYYSGDEGGYDGCDFVREHDLDDGVYTWVGFTGSKRSIDHTADGVSSVWTQVENGVLNNSTYYVGDVAVALEWRLGTIPAGESRELTVRFAFADTFDELKSMLCMAPPPPNVPTMSLWGTLGLTLLMAGGFVRAVYRRVRAGA